MRNPATLAWTQDADVMSAGRYTVIQWLLGGSWVVISRLIIPLIWVISIVTLLITPLKITHEPPSGFQGLGGRGRPLDISPSWTFGTQGPKP